MNRSALGSAVALTAALVMAAPVAAQDDPASTTVPTTTTIQLSSPSTIREAPAPTTTIQLSAPTTVAGAPTPTVPTQVLGAQETPAPQLAETGFELELAALGVALIAAGLALNPRTPHTPRN